MCQFLNSAFQNADMGKTNQLTNRFNTKMFNLSLKNQYEKKEIEIFMKNKYI